MASIVRNAGGGGVEQLFALAESEGSGRHRHLVALCAPRAPARDLADALHCLAMLHGRQPGVIDHAADRAVLGVAEPWLAAARDGFARERSLLATLVVAAGPLPSTPGQAESEAAVTAQHHALEMLGRSERTGCALGASIALTLDWRAIRGVLDAAADRLAVPPPALVMPIEEETRAVLAAVSAAPAAERALSFGAQQLLLQHRGLWDLLEARAAARFQAH